MDQEKFDWAFQNKGLQNSYAHHNCVSNKILIFYISKSISLTTTSLQNAPQNIMIQLSKGIFLNDNEFIDRCFI